jgi:hypothetical protein
MLRIHDQAKQVAQAGPPPSAQAIKMGNHSAIQNPNQEGNHGTLGRVQVPQGNSPMTRLHNSTQEQSRENRTNHLRVNR